MSSPYVCIDNRSDPLMQVVTTGNSFATQFETLALAPNAPTGNNVKTAGHDGAFAARRVFHLPYCNGDPGDVFFMRVFGIRSVQNPEGGAMKDVWVPFVLAVFQCTAGNLYGPTSTAPPGTDNMRFVKPFETMCDNIVLIQGSLGLTGEVNSFDPGTNYVAFTLTELRGARYFGTDFMLGDPPPQSMNALWARA